MTLVPVIMVGTPSCIAKFDTGNQWWRTRVRTQTQALSFENMDSDPDVNDSDKLGLGSKTARVQLNSLFFIVPYTVPTSKWNHFVSQFKKWWFWGIQHLFGRVIALKSPKLAWGSFLILPYLNNGAIFHRSNGPSEQCPFGIMTLMQSIWSNDPSE